MVSTMKRSPKYCAIVAFLVTASPLYGAVVLDHAQVGYWTFESDLSSATLGGNPISVIGGSPEAGWSGGTITLFGGTATRPGGIVGNAVNFNDVENDRARINEGSGTLGKSFTLSAWYYLDPLSNNGSTRYFVFESNANFDVSYGTSTGGTGAGNNNYNSYVGQNLVDGTSTSRQAWHHVLHRFTTAAGTTNLDVFIDGSLENSGTAPAANFDFTGINLGFYRTTSGDRDWDGLIDEVALWDRPLNNEEVAEVYNLGLAGEFLPAGINTPEPSVVGLIGFGAFLLRMLRREDEVSA